MLNVKKHAALARLAVLDGTWRGTARTMLPNGEMQELPRPSGSDRSSTALCGSSKGAIGIATRLGTSRSSGLGEKAMTKAERKSGPRSRPKTRRQSGSKIGPRTARNAGQTSDPKTLCATPTSGKEGTRIPTWKYEAVRRAILRVVPRSATGVEFRLLANLVSAELPDEVTRRLGSVLWHTVTVKLHLEVIGEIERVPGARPQRIRRCR